MFGRRVEHDPRSWGFQARKAVKPRSVLWPHFAPVLDQGQLSSCTGNALAQLLNTAKFTAARPQRRYLTEQDAVKIYSLGTQLDEFPGSYPPRDNGSSGLGVCKAGIKLGYLTAYRHTFSFDDAIAALALSPAIVGVNWYDDMMDTDSDGFIHVGGTVQGGHEVTLLGVNVRDEYVTVLNSWGNGWGRKGRARIGFPDFIRLLAEQGDVTIPERSST